MKMTKGAGLILLGVSLVVIDQVIKVLVKTNMELGEQIYLIGDWCRLCVVENKGMAFGMSFGGNLGKLLLRVSGGSQSSQKSPKHPWECWLG